MQKSWSYIKDSGDFHKKMKNIDKIPEVAVLVTADVIGLYPSISHEAGLEALRKIPAERDSPKIPTEDIVRMAEFVLKKTFLNSTARSNDKNLGQLLAQNLHLLMLASSWMK